MVAGEIHDFLIFKNTNPHKYLDYKNVSHAQLPGKSVFFRCLENANPHKYPGSKNVSPQIPTPDLLRLWIFRFWKPKSPLVSDFKEVPRAAVAGEIRVVRNL